MKHCNCETPATYVVSDSEAFAYACEPCLQDMASEMVNITATPLHYGRLYKGNAAYRKLEAAPVYASHLVTVAEAEYLNAVCGVPSPVSGNLRRYTDSYADTDSLHTRQRTAGERRLVMAGRVDGQVTLTHLVTAATVEPRTEDHAASR